MLSLNIVLGEVAILAHTVGVMTLVGVWASVSHFGLTLSMITVVAHVLGVVLSICVRAAEDLPPFAISRTICHLFKRFLLFLLLSFVFLNMALVVLVKFFIRQLPDQIFDLLIRTNLLLVLLLCLDL